MVLSVWGRRWNSHKIYHTTKVSHSKRICVNDEQKCYKRFFGNYARLEREMGYIYATNETQKSSKNDHLICVKDLWLK